MNNRSGGSKSFASATLSLVLLCTACASPGAGTAAPAAGPSTQAPSAPAKSVGAAAPRPADPTAPTSYQPIIRHGKRPSPHIKASLGGFSTAAPVRYPDGVTVSVKRVAHAVEKGRGPGVFPGRSHTLLTISLVNRSAQAVDLSQVVVTTTYGSPALVAAAVYEDASVRDFSGAVKPSASASATYAFALPAGRSSKVVTFVDFDGVHAAARFTGTLT